MMIASRQSPSYRIASWARRKWLVCAVFVCLQAAPASAQHSITPAQGTQEAILGSAYRSEREQFVGQACVEGDATSTGTSKSTFNFTQSISESQLSKELGMEMGGRARYGVVEASASATFAKNSTSNDFSVSAIYAADYVFPISKLSAPKVSKIGDGVRQNDERWIATCGDEYVSEVIKGAKLFFSVRVDFSSREEKQRFEAQFSISGPLAGVSGKLENASHEFSRQIRVTVSGMQIGGDVEKVTGIFDNTPEGLKGFTECSLGELSSCAKVVAAALKYATDTKTGFPSQLSVGALPGPSILGYRTVPYTAMGVFPNNYPGLTQAIRLARETLAREFEQQFKLATLAERLLGSPWARGRADRLSHEKATLDANIAQLLAISETCYNRPADCPNSVRGIKLAPIDESVFELPPRVSSSIRLWSIESGVFPRAESVAAMGSRIDIVSQRIAELGKGPKLSPPTVPSQGSFCGVSRESVTAFSAPDAAHVGTAASVVLLLEGVSLSEAELKFENHTLR